MHTALIFQDDIKCCSEREVVRVGSTFELKPRTVNDSGAYRGNWGERGTNMGREYTRTYNQKLSEKLTLVDAEEKGRESQLTRTMLINRSAPHPLSRKTPRGGKTTAKLSDGK